jgi:hypothetical protein
MDPLDEQILLYGTLSDEERAEVERLARTDPARAALLAESRTLHALLAEARAGDADLPDATALAEYVVGRHADRRPPPEVAERYARIEAALRERPEVERQARAFLRALEHYASEAEDPAAQFERLTGRTLKARRSDAMPAASAPDRPPLRLIAGGRRPYLRLALAASLALGVAYGALSVASRAALPERARLADLGAIPDAYEGIVLRGEPSGPATDDPAAEQYARALARLDDARHATLGLFPRYDAATLDAAARDLAAVTATAEPDSWQALEAAFLLGRVRIYQGRDGEAASAFTTVVEGEGPSAPEARRLLDWLDARNRAD